MSPLSLRHASPWPPQLGTAGHCGHDQNMEENVPSYSHHAALGLVIALDGPLMNMNTSGGNKGKKDFLEYIIFYQSSRFADLSINHVSVCYLLVSFHLISVVFDV